jgi:maltooligosyltrehalose trehalohydrolase
VLGEHSFVLRYFGDCDRDHRLLQVNLGEDQRFTPLPEPLLAPPRGMKWAVRWSSEDLAYGGSGTPALSPDDDWKLLGEAAVWLYPQEIGDG